MGRKAMAEVRARRETYTPNKELSVMFIRLINEHFSIYPNEYLFNQVNTYLTSNSGISAVNLQLGTEIVSAAAMFKVLKMINNRGLVKKFLSQDIALGELC